jgi:hypothetical protein
MLIADFEEVFTEFIKFFGIQGIKMELVSNHLSKPLRKMEPELDACYEILAFVQNQNIFKRSEQQLSSVGPKLM